MLDGFSLSQTRERDGMEEESVRGTRINEGDKRMKERRERSGRRDGGKMIRYI